MFPRNVCIAAFSYRCWFGFTAKKKSQQHVLMEEDGQIALLLMLFCGCSELGGIFFVFFHHHQLAYWFLSYLHFRISGQWKMYSLDFLVSMLLLLDERIMKSQFSLLNWKKAGFPLWFWLWPILWTLRSDRKMSRSLFGWRPAEVFLCGLALFSSKIPPFPCVLIQASCCW